MGTADRDSRWGQQMGDSRRRQEMEDSRWGTAEGDRRWRQ